MLNRRNFLSGVSVAAIIASTPAQAWIHGSGVSRLLFVLYGQSNMSGFSGTSSSPPAAAANTFFYNGSSLGAVPAADGIRIFMNDIANTTGRTCVALNGAVPGAGLPILVKPSANYNALMAQINAVLLPSDQVMILWDQGEGDANADPHPDENAYKTLISQLHSDLASDMGRSKATCPFIIASLGTTSVAGGGFTTGTTDVAWQTIKNAHYNCSLEQPFVHFSHTNIDLVRSDSYHYLGADQGKQGARFGQTVKTILGLASGEAHWQISNGATVDATHTNINLVQNLGTDFTPASGANGWEASGDNGATWVAATGARNSASQIQLTHASLSTTSTRIVRNQWGMLPPNASGVNPTTAPVLDNSALAVPLNYTTWDIRPTPLSALPVPTWRYNQEYAPAGQIQLFPAMPLGPSIGAQKFVILSLAGTTRAATVTLTPKDAQGNPVGSPVVATLVKAQGSVQIQQAVLGAGANAAYAVDVSVDYGGNPFAVTLLQLWTVPLSTLNSTTATGTGGASAAANTAVTATVNVSAGGFIIQGCFNSTLYSAACVLSGTETYAKRFERSVHVGSYSADASNCSASATSSATATFAVAANLDLALASWF